MKKEKKLFLTNIILLVVSVVYTVLAKTVDVRAIGPKGSSVGFSKLNEAVHSALQYNNVFYTISKYLGILAFAIVTFYFLLGLKQLLTEKKLSKVDSKIIGLGCFYIVFAIIYILFEKIALNYRPVLMDGELEASFPSTHTLLAICICGSAIMANKTLISNDTFRKLFNIGCILLMLGIVVARILSGVHWASDIIGGIIISLFLLSCLETYFVTVEKGKHE